jgi:methanogenic corrinoid protein MtbC1
VRVAEEHFARATTKAVMAQLQPHLPVAPRNGRTVVGASVEGNTHDLGLQMVCDFLEMDGWRVVFLGASVPAADLAIAAQVFRADVVALAANLASHLEPAAQAIRLVRAEAPGTRILVGGPVFLGEAGLWRDLGADGWAADALQAVDAARSLAGLAPAGA